MTNPYFSQHGEDQILEPIIQRYPVPKLCIEIGALDGIEISNIRHFVLDGYSGVFVEPLPEEYLKLIQNYRNNPNVKTINGVVTNSDEKYLSFSVRKIRAWSSIDSNDAMRSCQNDSVIEVKNYSFAEMLKEAECFDAPIGILSIDIEGNEKDILPDVMTHKNKPYILIVESNGENDRKAQIDMLSSDFAVWRIISDNTIFFRNDYFSQTTAKV